MLDNIRFESHYKHSLKDFIPDRAAICAACWMAQKHSESKKTPLQKYPADLTCSC